MSNDRRTHHRVSKIDKIQLFHQKKSFKFNILDISPKGFSITSDCHLSNGAIVKVLIGSHPNIDISAKVISRKEVNFDDETFRYGLLFYMLSEDAKLAIKSAFESNDISIDRRRNDRRIEKSSIRDEKRNINRRESSTFYSKVNRLSNSFDVWTTYHTYLRPISSSDLPVSFLRGREQIMLGSNSFLGLSSHPRVKEAAKKAIELFGVGSGGPPVLNGTTTLHDELCEAIANFKGTESAVLFPSGYIANFACLSTLFEEDDILLNDDLNHASLIDGSRHSKATTRFFKHNNMDDLEKKLSQYEVKKNKLIIVDGISSMNGDLCDLPGILKLAEKYNSLVMVDDAHSTGVVGKTGRGTAEHFGLTGKVDLTTVTLSKSLGSVGGAICGSKAMVKYLIHLARPFIFSASLPPAICAAALESLRIIKEQPSLIQDLRNNVQYLSNGLRNLGYNVCASDSAIIPVIIGGEHLTYRLAYELEKCGVFVNAVSRPAVPRELSRLRLSPTAQHKKSHLDLVIEAFEKVGKELNIIPSLREVV